MKNFELDLQYMEHDGGTKFYETVVLTERVTGAGVTNLGPSILIQRWGKIAQNTGGGSTKTVKGSASHTGRARNKVINEKLSDRLGKGKYLPAKSPFFGFGRACASGHTTQISEKDMQHIVVEHYGKNDQNTIANYFGLELDMDLSDGDEDDIVEEGLDDNDRGPQWASW